MRPGEKIIREVAEAYGVRAEDVKGPRRLAKLARIRWEAMARIRDELGYSTTLIGQLFDRDHTAVIYALRRHAGEGVKAAKSAREAA